MKRDFQPTISDRVERQRFGVEQHTFGKQKVLTVLKAVAKIMRLGISTNTWWTFAADFVELCENLRTSDVFWCTRCVPAAIFSWTLLGPLVQASRFGLGVVGWLGINTLGQVCYEHLVVANCRAFCWSHHQETHYWFGFIVDLYRVEGAEGRFIG